MSDPISDMLTRIRNAQAVSKPDISLPFSSLKYSIAKILEKEGLIESTEKKGRGPKKKINIVLKYNEEGPVISGLKRVSKPGQRLYYSSKDIRPVRGGFGIAIVSTPKGLMTDRDARKKNIGGEIICEVW